MLSLSLSVYTYMHLIPSLLLLLLLLVYYGRQDISAVESLQKEPAREHGSARARVSAPGVAFLRGDHLSNTTRQKQASSNVANSDDI